MATNKKNGIREIVSFAWNAVGEQSIKASISALLKTFSASLQEKYGVQDAQLQPFADSLSDLVCYIISQQLNKKAIRSDKVMGIVQTGVVPAVAAIASTNPKGEEIVSSISSLVGNITANPAMKTILQQMAGKEISEQLAATAFAIAAINQNTGSVPTRRDATGYSIPEAETKQQTEIPECPAVSDCSVEVSPTTCVPTVKENMTEEEEEQFINDVYNAVQLDFSSPQAVAESFRRFAKVTQEVAKFAEMQETKRTQIRMDAEVAIKKVEAMRDTLKEYLDKSFDERSAIFAKQFEVVDKALATGDNAMLSMGLTSINELAASSPFKALADINSVQQMLTDDSEFDL